MNTDIFKNNKYRDKLEEFFYDIEFKNTYPYEEYHMLEVSEKVKEVENAYNLLQKCNIFCKIDSRHYAILNLNGIDYIVSVDDDSSFSISGTTLSNWIANILSLYGDEHTLLEFMEFCFKEFDVPIEYPDYDALWEIEEQFLKPLING
jgi:hypothetical protein